METKEGQTPPKSMREAQETVLQWVRAAMKHARLRQTRLAEHIGLNQSKVSRVLTGDRQLSAAEMVLVAKVTGYSMSGVVETIPADVEARVRPDQIDALIREAFDACTRHGHCPDADRICRYVQSLL